MKRTLRIAALFCSLIATLATSQSKDVIRLPVPYMQQPDGETCLPTSLCMAMHFLGRIDLSTATVHQLHKSCHYDRYNLPKLVQNYDLYAFPSWLEHAWTRETVEAELRAGRPVILGLDCSRAGHFVLAVGYTDDGKVIIHDPYWKEPGWQFGGPFVTTNWAPLMWRNGIILHTEGFTSAPRALSGNMVASTAPRTMLPGQNAVAEFSVKNNGTTPWPDEVYLAPVEAYTSAPRERVSPFTVLPGQGTPETSGTWISATRVAAPARKNLAPGEIVHFAVPLHAPQVSGPTNFRENFNLVDGQGHWFSEHWMTGPSNRQMNFRIPVVPRMPGTEKLPLVETAASGKLALPWRYKFTTDTAQITITDKTETAATEGASTSTITPPDGTPRLKLTSSPGEQFQVAFVGDPLGQDYRVESWVFCEYRPQSDPLYDRYGIFMHDDGTHRLAPKTELENGDCILMCYDTDNGRLRCGNFEKGGVGDFRRAREATYIKETGWHKFGIRTAGTTVTFELDGKTIHTVRNASRYADEAPRAFESGDCGVFYRSAFPNEADRRGALFAGFRVDP